MKGLRFVLVAALVAVALVGAGCGGDDDDAEDTTTTETTFTTDTTTEETTTTETTEAGSALEGSVGPGFTISLTADGEPVTTLAPGSYELQIEDLSAAHNFHLSGPAVDISTAVAEEGTQEVSLELQSGTYSFVCDPHATQMSGTFTVS